MCHPNCPGLLLSQPTSLASPARWCQIFLHLKNFRAGGQIFPCSPKRIPEHYPFHLPPSCKGSCPSELEPPGSGGFHPALPLSLHPLTHFPTLTEGSGTWLPLHNSCHHPGRFQDPWGWFIPILQPPNAFITVTFGLLNHLHTRPHLGPCQHKPWMTTVHFLTHLPSLQPLRSSLWAELFFKFMHHLALTLFHFLPIKQPSP